MLSLTAVLPCFAGEVKDNKNISEDELIPLEKIEILTLDSREKAESFAETLESSGYRAIIITEDKGDKQVHRVFILINQGEQDNNRNFSTEPSQGSAELKPTQDEERLYEEMKPLWDILGRQKRYVHGALTFTGIYTDNVLNSRDNKKSDFSTILSPAIWFVFPHTRQDIAPLALALRSPGGSLLSRQWPDSPFHYQASLYYRADIPLISSSGNLRYGTTPAQTLSGKLLIKGNRLSLLAEDHYEFSYHEQEAGIIIGPGERERYNSNYFGVTLSYETRNRLVLNGGYSYFLTRYQSDLSDFRNRQDNGLFTSLSYRVSPRLSLLAEYRFFDISYDQTGDIDSNEHYFLGGILWDITAKSKGVLKAGYGVKDFDHSLGSFKYFSFEVRVDHRFTPKTSMFFIAYRKASETNVSGMSFSLTNGLEVKLQHILTARLTSSAGFLMMNDHYKKGPELTEGIDSTIYQASLTLQYEFRRWLKGSVGYTYTMKDASLSDLEYRSNTFYFNLTSAI